MWTTVVQPLLAQCYKSLTVSSGGGTRSAIGSTGALLMMPQILHQMRVKAAQSSAYIPLKDCEVFALQQIS
jgi:hypothetical protein